MENQSAGIIRSILQNNKNVDQALADRVNLIIQGSADEVEYTKFIFWNKRYFTERAIFKNKINSSIRCNIST